MGVRVPGREKKTDRQTEATSSQCKMTNNDV